MSYGIVFRGTYRYEDGDAAERAVRAAREDVAYDEGEADADLAAMVRDGFDRIVVRDGASIRIDVDQNGPPGLYPIYETLVETLAGLATSGTVVSRMDGVEDEFPAGSEDG